MTLQDLRKFFENLAAEWDDAQPEFREEKIHNLLEPFDPFFSRSQLILEAGTGTGALIPILKCRYPKSQVVCVDLAFQMLLKAKTRVSESLLVQSDVHCLPFPDRYFDALICHNSFPHFWWQDEVLITFRRKLKPGGAILIFHDICREEVNEVHKNAQADIIHGDQLEEGFILSERLKRSGFTPQIVEDTNQHYLIYAKC